MTLEKSLPIDINCFSAILVKNGSPEEISSILKIKEPIIQNWDLAIRMINGTNNTDSVGRYEAIIITEEIKNWNYVIFKMNKDLNYSMNCCNELSIKYDELFSLLLDVHSGNYRFMKFKGRKLVRFFERDFNQVTGEFGEKTEEELRIEKRNEGDDYFYAVEVSKEILSYDNAKDEIFDKQLIVGKRYYKEVERYPDLFDEIGDLRTIDKNALNNNEDLPF